MSINGNFIGKVIGTGAAINVPLGFVPDYVCVQAADASQIDENFFDGMADGASLRAVAAGTRSLVAANGLFKLDSPTLGKGFTIGSTVSQTGKTLLIFAGRNVL